MIWHLLRRRLAKGCQRARFLIEKVRFLPVFRNFHGFLANGRAFAIRESATQLSLFAFALGGLMYVMFLPSLVAVAVIGFITLRDQFQFSSTAR